MSDPGDECSFPIPNWFRKSFKSLLYPGQDLEDVFDHICHLEFEESNEIKTQERIWGSKTMTLDKKKSKTLDMFFSKVIKTEISEHDSVDSVVDINDASDLKHFCGGGTPKKTKHVLNKNISHKENKKEYLEEQEAPAPKKHMDKKITSKTKDSCHAISTSEDESADLIIENSPTYSEDLFAEEVPTTVVGSKMSKKKKEIEHPTSDEEIIPSSQTHEIVNRLNLGSLSAVENCNSNKFIQISSGTEESCRSPKEHITKPYVSRISSGQTLSTKGHGSSSEEEHNEQRPLSQLDSVQNRMKNISEVFTETNLALEKSNFGDLTKDDEVYILQCPTEMDTKKLEGVKLNLQGNSMISLVGEENNKYDCFSLMGSSKRCLYVALPDINKKQMKIGVYPLFGNVILSENLDIPYTALLKDDFDDGYQNNTCYNEIRGEESRTYTNKNFDENPQKYETQFEEESTECLNHSSIEVSPNKLISKKKKKKKHKNTEDETQNEAASTDSFNQKTTEVFGCLLSKKKKRKHSYGEYGTQNEEESIECFNESLTEESPSKLTVKKKKKRKHKNSDDETLDETASSACFSHKTTEDVFDRLLSKKKKRKHSHGECNEVDSSLSDVNHFLNIKREWETPQVVSDYQDGTQNEEDSIECFNESLTEESTSKLTLKKKKKKKHKNSDDETQDETASSACFSHKTTEDVFDRLLSKRKKRKHSHGECNEIDSSMSDVDQYLNIKREWENPKVVSDYQETPKYVKRKRKDI